MKTIVYNGVAWSAAVKLAAGKTLSDTYFKLTSKRLAVAPGNGCKIIRVRLDGGGLVNVTQVNDVTIDTATCDALDQNFAYLGGDAGIHRPNKGWKFLNLGTTSNPLGYSRHEHVFRFHNFENLLMRNCITNNWKTAAELAKYPKVGADLILKDGINAIVEGCTFGGVLALGPTADGDGGGYDPPGPNRDRLLNKRCRDVVIQGCTIHRRVDLEAGVVNVRFVNCVFTGTGPLVNIKARYFTRPIATGSLEGCRFTANNPILFSGDKSGFKVTP